MLYSILKQFIQFLFLFTICSTTLFANLNVDLKTIPKDSIQKRASYYEDAFYDKIGTGEYSNALMLVNKALIEFEGNIKIEYKFWRFKGLSYDYMGEYLDSSHFYSHKSVLYSKKYKDYSYLSKTYADLGSHFHYQNILDSATYYYLLADQTNKKITPLNLEMAGTIQNNIGLIKSRQKDYAIAKEYFLEAISTYDQMEDKDIAQKKRIRAYINITICCRKLNEYQEAITYSDLVFFYAKNTNDTILFIDASASKSLIFFEMEAFRKSVDVSLLGYSYMTDKFSSKAIPHLYNLTLAYRELEIYDSSIYYNKIGLEVANQTGLNRNIASFNKNIQRTYSIIGDYENAYKHLKTYLELINLEENNAQYRTIEEMEQKYRAQKKTHQVEVLKQKSEIQNLYVIALIIVVLLVLFLSYFVFLKRKTRYQLELALEKDKISTAILIGQEDERKRISIELHDSIGASLANISMRLSSYIEKQNNLSSEHQLSKLQINIDNSCKEIRLISHDLAPYKIEKEGLAFAIEDLLNGLNEIQSTHFKSSILISEDLISLLTKSIIYRIIQELSTNICKHAKATLATINIEKVEKKLIVQIKDNGKGLNSNVSTDGIGLKNVKTRIAYLNGKLEVVTQKNYGVLYTIVFPLK